MKDKIKPDFVDFYRETDDFKKSDKILKEYNQWELRFLQVLVLKERYAKIMKYNYDLLIDRMLFRGSKPFIIQPSDKIEFVCNNLEISEAGTDYLVTINSMIKALKKDIAKGSGVKYEQLFGKEEANGNDN